MNQRSYFNVYMYTFSFFKFFLSSFVGTIANIYLAEKNWALLVDLLKVKKAIIYIIVSIVKRMVGK